MANAARLFSDFCWPPAVINMSGSCWPRPAITLAQGRGNNCIVAKMASVGLKRPVAAAVVPRCPATSSFPSSSSSLFLIRFDSFCWISETAGRISSSVDPSSSSANEMSTYEIRYDLIAFDSVPSRSIGYKRIT